MTTLPGPLQELYTRSRILVLDFDHIPPGTPKEESIAEYFRAMKEKGINPRLPEYRQAFNDRLLARTSARYLVSQYGEDRRAMLEGSAIAKEGRTIHLGIDIFSRDLEAVSAPCDGTIIRAGKEEGPHSFGNYVILKPKAKGMPFFFFGHLSDKLPPLGNVRAGDTIGVLGDYKDNENGGWSRHLHLQCLKDLPLEGTMPIGYASHADFKKQKAIYPDPMQYFPDWHLK